MTHHEFNARARKVSKLVDAIDLLQRRTPTIKEFRALKPDWWRGLAMLADVKEPSQTTIDAVIAIYERRQGAA